MNVNFHEIKIKHGKEQLTIIPVEAHYSRRTKSNGFCRETWFRLIARVKKDPLCRVVFVGDMLDADRPSLRNRKVVMYAEPDRHAALSEDDMDHQKGLRDGIISDLRPIRNQIIGMVDGDHFRQYENGTTSTWYIANALGIPKTYLGERMGWVRLHIIWAAKSPQSTVFDIFVRHGRASASNFGTDVNALIRQNVGFDAQLYVGGHTHRSWFVKIPWLYCGKKEIKQRFVGYARAGSLLRGFLFGETTYPEIAEYSPLSIGWPEVYLITSRNHSDNARGIWVKDMKGLT